MTSLKLLGIGFGLLLNHAAMSTGFQFQNVPDPDDKTLEVGIWYPSDAVVPKKPNTPFRQALARKGKVKGERLPLVIISHGFGGWMGGHADLAKSLADAGFVVAAPTHTGNNDDDESYTASRWMVDRPRHVSRVIDYMHTQWKQRAALDVEKTAVYGFSAGGYTVMSLAGAEVNVKQLTDFCDEQLTERACEMGLDKEVENNGLAKSGQDISGKDKRIKAVVTVAPAFGFAYTAASLNAINVPMQIWSGALDVNVPYESNVVPMLAGLKNDPEIYNVEDAGHFAFMKPCNAELKAAKPTLWEMICVDKKGFDRAAFQLKHHELVQGFLRKVLK